MKKILLPLLALSGVALQPAIAQDAEKLLQEKACVACHAKDVKLVGPAYVEVAKRYADQDDAVATLVNSILKGSQGKYGEVPMPPNAVSEAEAKALAEWVMSLK